jgi:hypothetical protein
MLMNATRQAQRRAFHATLADRATRQQDKRILDDIRAGKWRFERIQETEDYDPFTRNTG